MFPEYSTFCTYHHLHNRYATLWDTTRLTIDGIGTAVYTLNGKTILSCNALHIPALRGPIYYFSKTAPMYRLWGLILSQVWILSIIPRLNSTCGGLIIQHHQLPSPRTLPPSPSWLKTTKYQRHYHSKTCFWPSIYHHSSSTSSIPPHIIPFEN